MMQTGKEIIKELYEKDFVFVDENNKAFDVPLYGSLAMLAEGYRGLIAVRKKRKLNKFSLKNEFLVKKEIKGNEEK